MDKQAILQQCPLFSALPDIFLKSLIPIAYQRAVKKGHEFFQQGDPCDGFYIVADGSVKVYLLSVSGREQVLNVAKPGQSFAEAALFSGKDFPVYAEALEDTLVLFFPRESFLRLIQDYPEISFHMLAGLSGWLRKVIRLMEDTILEDVDTRLARFLLQHAVSSPLQNRSGGKVQLSMQKQVLASYLGTTPPTLSRAFKRLEEEKLILVNDREIQFLDMERFTARAEMSQF